MMFSSVFQSRCFFLAKREMDRWSDRQMDDWTGRQIDGCGKVGGREDKGGRRRRGGGGVEVVRGTISTSCVFWQSRTLHIPVWLMYNLLLNHHTFISLYACCKHTHTPVHTHTNLREVNIISTQDWLPIDYFDVWRCVDLELQLVVCSATLTISSSLPSHRLKLMQFLSSSFSWVFMCVLWFFFFLPVNALLSCALYNWGAVVFFPVAQTGTVTSCSLAVPENQLFPAAA